MRLLQRDHDGELSLTQDFLDGKIPEYAILSHTWGPDAEEVTFKDLVDRTGHDKSGFEKIRFCGEQAKRDDIDYFWVDTCCIDKSNNSELSEAINSMFRWYCNAVKCYVYLPDVSGLHAVDGDDTSGIQHWESELRRSRWFTRGWTLQELIAPKSVEFFSKEGNNLGNKVSLGRVVSEITGIPAEAFQNQPLSNFSVTERMVWAEKRVTSRKEDKAYSLLGIFNVHMPLIYGEGEDKALKRLREEIDKSTRGTNRDDFSITFSLADVSGIEHFVARQKELTEIHSSLVGDGSRRTVILHGLGGIGKTQLSIEYAKRHRNDYSAIFWLNINDESSLKQSFARVAKQILREHPSATQLSRVDMKENLDEIVDAVKAWLSLSGNTRWLMVYDNYDNPRGVGNKDPAAVDVRKFLPESHQGSVLITTRSSQVGLGHRIPISKLESLHDSLEILSNTSGRKNIMHDHSAVELAGELDGLPLALATAGAYLDQVAMSFSVYLRLYKESWARLLQSGPELSSYEDRSLYSTWQVSFDQIKQQNPLSAQLLQFWAYFDHQDIWFELLKHSDDEDLRWTIGNFEHCQVPKWIEEIVEDEMAFHGAMRVLIGHGLVEIASYSQELIESRGYSIHGCVHSWTIHVLNQKWEHDLARVAIQLVGSHVPRRKDGLISGIKQRRLLQHAARCSYMVSKNLVDRNNVLRALNQLGYLYDCQNRLNDAGDMYRQALEGYTISLGPDHRLTQAAAIDFGILCVRHDKPDEAARIFEMVLQGNEGLPKLDHLMTFDPEHLSYIGDIYLEQGKLDRAEKFFQMSLQVTLEALGPDHPSTFSSALFLIEFLINQNRLEEAEQWLLGFKNTRDPQDKIILIVARCYIRCTVLSRDQVIRPQYLSNSSREKCLREAIADIANIPDIHRHISKAYVFGRIGQLLIWAGAYNAATLIFLHMSHLLPASVIHWNTWCNGDCGSSLRGETDLFVCETCYDNDLCEPCFINYKNHGSISGERSKNCIAHSFFRIPQQEKSVLESACSCIFSRVPLSQWLKDICPDEVSDEAGALDSDIEMAD